MTLALMTLVSPDGSINADLNQGGLPATLIGLLNKSPGATLTNADIITLFERIGEKELPF